MSTTTTAPDTILARLARWTASQPEKPCYTFCDAKMRVTQSLTYAQLDGVTAALAARLLAQKEEKGYGLCKGDRVLLVYPPSLDFIAAYLACLRAGLVAVPVFPPIPGQLKKDLHHFASIHASSGAKVALTNTTYNHAKRLVQLKEKFSKSKMQWPEDIRWIVTDKDLKVNTKGTTAAAAAGAAAAAAAAAPTAATTAAHTATGVARDTLAFLQYTSGSTSEPKGVMISHENLAHNLSTIVAALGANRETSCVAWLPQYHDMGLIGSYLGTLYCGGSGYYMSPISFVKRPITWVEMMSKYKATHTQAPNFAYKLAARKFNAMPETKRPRDLNLSSLQHMFNAAEPVTADAIADFEAAFCPLGLPRGVIVPGYGLAEHTVYVCDRGRQRVCVSKRILLEEHRADVLDVLVDIGTAKSSNSSEGKEGVRESGGGKTVGETEAVAATSDAAGAGVTADQQILIGVGHNKGIDVRIVNKETRCEVTDAGMVGEIWVNSPSKAGGYFGKEELSKDIFFAELAYSTDEESEHNAETDERTDTAEEKKQDKPLATYLRTGDLGFMYNDELFICGRDKDLIIIRGRNHYPQDIEKTVEEEGTRIRGGCSAAFSVTNGPTEDGAVGGCAEEVLVVVAEVRDPKKYKDFSEFASRLSKKVTQDHGVGVHKLVLVKPRSIDKTSSGKIARQWVRKAYLAQSLSVVAESSSAHSVATGAESDGHAGEAKTTQDEEGAVRKVSSEKKRNAARATQDFNGDDLDNRLREMVAEMTEGELDPESVSMDASLIELGLGSMQVVQLGGQIGEEFGLELDEEEMFSEDMTLARMKILILSKQNGGAVAAPKVKPVEFEPAVNDEPGDGLAAAKKFNTAPSKRTKKSTLQIVFCFCCNSSSADTAQNRRKDTNDDADW